MEDKDFVPFETAKKLKEAEFDCICNSLYHKSLFEDGKIELWTNRVLNDWNKLAKFTSAPTLWKAQKWLREEKGIEVSVAWCRRRMSYYFWYGEMSCRDEDVKFGYDFPYYEAALSAGIDAALELITNKTENT